MAAERLRYAYKPLQTYEIRVLHLLPGENGAPLEAMLEHIPLSAASETEYETISYAWGSRDVPYNIGLEDGTYVPITASLYEALSQFRYPDESRALWADALCINQDDSTERSAQVSIMGEIFRASSKVLVWLGISDETDEAAFAVIKACSRIPPDRRNGGRSHYRAIESEMNLDPDFPNPQVFRTDIYSFSKLLQRHWFSRLWVIEEVTFGRSVRLYSGSRFTTWEKFTSCLFQLRDLRNMSLADDVCLRVLDRNWLSRMCQTMEQIEYRRGADEGLFSAAGFLTAMHTFSERKCQEPHDRIYALRRFLGLHIIGAQLPDYRLDPGEVYKHVVEHLLLDAQTYSESTPHTSLIFGLVGTEVIDNASNPKVQAYWPSWVPDFHHLSERSRCKHDRYSLPELAQFTWKNTTFPQCHFPTNEPTHLSIKAAILGKVVSTLPSSQCPRQSTHTDASGALFEELLPKLLEWLDICADYVQDQSFRSKELQGILCCDDPHAGNELSRADFPQHEAMQSQTHEAAVWLHHAIRPFLTYDHHPRHDSDRILCHIQIDATLTFGWVPSAAQPGDFIAAFAGAPYAFVLREAETRQQYLLLGDAQLSGLSPHIDVHESTFGYTMRKEADECKNLHEKFQTGGPGPLEGGTKVSDEMGWITLV